jgi:uncharacterized protein (TIGR03083 family)
MDEARPVLVINLFPEERKKLIKLLRPLSEDELAAPTICEGWSVKDIGLHLLGDDISVISRKDIKLSPRDKEDERLDEWIKLVKMINEANDLWVKATRRLSKDLLCDFLEFTGQKVFEYYKSLDPFEIGKPVNWAGPNPAPNWLSIAREYTERWLHQQHIRMALDRSGMKEPKFFAPVIKTYLFALPRTYKDIQEDTGTIIEIIITGDSGGKWLLVRHKKVWKLFEYVEASPKTSITLDQDLAWRLFTKGIDKEKALKQISIDGDKKLGQQIINTISIIG